MSEEELAYYRAVEDQFARLRGTPFLFSPKDFALLRQWWRDGVPLAAVIAGIGEAIAKRKARTDDPVSSLSYCRHAVARHAKRLAAAAVGGVETGGADVPARLRGYSAAVRDAAARFVAHGEVAAALSALAGAVETLPADAPPAALEATVTSLEAAWLEAAEMALPDDERRAFAAAVAAAEAVAQAATGGDGELPPAVRRAVRLQALRAHLGVPRFELLGEEARRPAPKRPSAPASGQEGGAERPRRGRR